MKEGIFIERKNGKKRQKPDFFFTLMDDKKSRLICLAFSTALWIPGLIGSSFFYRDLNPTKTFK